MPADMATAPSWPQGPASPLPRRVTPFHTETVQSYLDRLAHANHLGPRQLRRYLADGPAICRPRQDWLATASGQPVAILRARLVGLTGADHDHDPTRQRCHARPACRFCMARHRVYEPVYCWVPDHRTVCRRHRRWIGPGARSHTDQRDLHAAPVVVAAAYRHARLHRQYRESARFAIQEATRILRWWATPGSGALAGGATDVDAYITAYPDLVDLAAILADARRHIWAATAARPAHSRALGTVYTRCAQRFPQHRDRTRPIEQWVYDQQLIVDQRSR